MKHRAARSPVLQDTVDHGIITPVSPWLNKSPLRHGRITPATGLSKNTILWKVQALFQDPWTKNITDF